MANRRMVNIRLIDSDLFLDMPLSAQALYFHMLMRADDDGFINSPMRLLRTLGCNNDDYKLLIAKGLILAFETGVIVIKHWRLHNYLRKDRYHESVCQNEKEQLYLEDDGAYTFENTGKKVKKDTGQPDGNHLETSGCPRLGKVRLGKDSLDNNIMPEQVEQPKQENDDETFRQSYPGAREFKVLLKNGEYVVTENTIERLIQLYPGLDVVAEMRKLVAWCENNPAKRKTSRGINRFINGWMNRAFTEFVQKPKYKAGQENSNRHNFTQREYDFDDLEEKLLRKQFEEGEP